MSGTVELDAGGNHLLIRFAYREDLVDEVRALPGRRWDKQNKTWKVPAGNVDDVYAALARHLFEFAPEVMSLMAGTLGESPPTGDEAVKPRRSSTRADRDATSMNTDNTLSVSALNERVRAILQQSLPGTLWLTGEVIDYDKQEGRAHKFFSLIEKDEGDARPKARVEAALFERTAAQLLPQLQQQAPDFTLRDGIEIRVRVRVDIYPASGRYQVIVEEIDPSFTLGKLALQKEETLRELRRRGLHERNRLLALPTPLLRIGVLASPESDGWNDFLRHLQESDVGFQVTLVPVKVQGVELKPTMLAALAWFTEHARDYDALCVIRGGGSRTDLAWFDDLQVALAVAQHPLKVLVGIGHQRDQSVLDVIAHSHKTPTAVAEFLCELAQEERRATLERAMRLAAGVQDLLAEQRGLLSDLAARLRHHTLMQLRQQRQRLRLLARDMARGTRLLLVDSARSLLDQGRMLHSTALLRVERAQSRLRTHQAALAHGAQRLLERAAARLDQQQARQRLLDPRHVVRRGFAIVRDKAGKVLPEAKQISVDQPLRIELRDGMIQTRAEAIEPRT
jgi:exodeoxyribonuclease VII large subunit